MKKCLKFVLTILFVSALAGCFAEDYDVGVPRAYVQVETGMRNHQTQLTEANINWSSSSGDVTETTDDIEEFALTQDEIKVSPNQDAFLDFKENEENGGDIWSDPTITASLWQDGEATDLELNEFREFRFPSIEGDYVLEVEFIDMPNEAQYVGNIVIDQSNIQTRIIDGQMPEFTLMEMPSIVKIDSENSPGSVFDHIYSEVCWNNCGDREIVNYSNVHAGKVEIGDEIHIDWGEMEPSPTEVNLIEINNAGEEIREEKISADGSSLNIQVGEEEIGKQYSVQYLWRDGEELIGQSSLDFKLE